jgi:hypothetical protein
MEMEIAYVDYVHYVNAELLEPVMKKFRFAAKVPPLVKKVWKKLRAHRVAPGEAITRTVFEAVVTCKWVE